MKKALLSVAALAALGFGAQAASITDLFKQLDGYNVLKTAGAVGTLGNEKNVGMESFRAGGLKGSLYSQSHGVVLKKGEGLLTNKLTVEGFYNGNFDVELELGLGVVNVKSITPREVKPDGTPAEYAGKVATITPCIVIKDLIYVPVSQMSLMGYYSDKDATGLDNLQFNAVTIPNIAENIADLIPSDVLAKLIKAAVDSQISNATIKALVGKIIDGVVGDGSDPSKYLSLLDGAKVNAFQLKVASPAQEETPEEGGAEVAALLAGGSFTENFNGYELHTIEATATVTDRIHSTADADFLKLGYVQKNEADPTREYKIAFRSNDDGTFEIYNFNNGGMAIRSSATTITLPDGKEAKGFANVLSPVTGTMNLQEGVFTLDNRQQLGANPILITEAADWANSQTIYQLIPVVNSKLGEWNIIPGLLRPSWNKNDELQNTIAIGKPVHNNSRWHGDSFGSLKTYSDVAEITVGDYCPANALMTSSGTITETSLSDGPIVYDTRWKLEGIEVNEITHNVAMNLADCSFDAGKWIGKPEGLLIQGSIEEGVKNPYVESYDLYVAPVNVDKAFEEKDGLIDSRLIKPSENGNGIQYRFGATHNTWSEAVLLDENYDVEHVDAPNKARGTVGTGSFSKFIPYSDMPKYKLGWGWTKVDPDGKDTYTVYLKTNYTEESGLEPTFHALNTIKAGNDNVTGIEGIEVEEGATGAAVYFNLQGIEVDSSNLTPGIYVKKQGDKSEKVIVK